MKILVTGGAGFIGSHIAEAHLAQGDEVTVLDNLATGRRVNVPEGARLVEADIRDAAAIDAVVRQGEFNLINHHAAQVGVGVSVQNPQYDAELNVLGSLNLFQAAARHGAVPVIFASSGGTVYGEQHTFPADESHPTLPACPYGISKLAVEHYLRYYHAEQGLRSVILRYTNVYGPRQHGDCGVISIFCDRMIEGVTPTINGSGEFTRDYVYIEDVVRANLLAARHLSHYDEHQVFNVCTGIETSVNRIFHTLNADFGGRFNEQHGPPKPGEQTRSVCSFDRIERGLGWRPQIDLDEGIRRTTAAARQEREARGEEQE